MTNDDLTRRTFVKTSIAAGSAALLPAQSPNDTVRVAFIGVGNRGSYLLKNMLKVPGIKVVAICDIDPEALKKAVEAATAAGNTPEPYAEFRAMLDRKDIDAVVIATPVDLHKEMAITRAVPNGHQRRQERQRNIPGGLPVAPRPQSRGVHETGPRGRHRQGFVPAGLP
jgi:FlaA1/EpsC-like NDP-sugar epimerase